MRQPVAQGELGVEVDLVLLRLPLGRPERDEHVGVATLGADERFRIGLAPVELGQYLVGRVAAARAVALDLPPAPQLLGRVEEHAHVVDVAHLGQVVAEQSLDHREPLGVNIDRRTERTVLVPVDGLDDRLAPPQVPEVLGDDVEVVAVRVERA